MIETNEDQEEYNKAVLEIYNTAVLNGIASIQRSETGMRVNKKVKALGINEVSELVYKLMKRINPKCSLNKTNNKEDS